ncbi:P27 family phage terminase small subunit [Enterococcus casseliflavus]|uniref:P27 family phage terminase small subunit n=1 Tax=Enterococcus casseliflavus TaxID=37734 RepID=UPI001CA98C5A|nr:P27 family phage terminase small subunit [Enterococcus casseliflavus]MBZ0323543.1 P27 family phage terminase small subunit [Enterococcus casseliflavus]
MTTKAQRKAIVDGKVTAEKERILTIMRQSDIYMITLDPLIESYLDIFEIYQYKFLAWKEKGFPETQKYTNKSGATNPTKHPLAQQVEFWSDKKMKALDYLGLTNKAATGKKVTGGSTARQNEEITRPQEKPVDELAEHRNKWRAKQVKGND